MNKPVKVKGFVAVDSCGDKTDAFIEKACEFWTKNQRGFVTYKDIVDFKNFMKGK